MASKGYKALIPDTFYAIKHDTRPMARPWKLCAVSFLVYLAGAAIFVFFVSTNYALTDTITSIQPNMDLEADGYTCEMIGTTADKVLTMDEAYVAQNFHLHEMLFYLKQIESDPEDFPTSPIQAVYDMRTAFANKDQCIETFSQASFWESCAASHWMCEYSDKQWILRACADTDNGALDSSGDPCPLYNSNTAWCGNYDDVDFNSNQMCCACGGGSTGGSTDPNWLTTSSLHKCITTEHFLSPAQNDKCTYTGQIACGLKFDSFEVEEEHDGYTNSYIQWYASPEEKFHYVYLLLPFEGLLAQSPANYLYGFLEDFPLENIPAPVLGTHSDDGVTPSCSLPDTVTKDFVKSRIAEYTSAIRTSDPASVDNTYLSSSDFVDFMCSPFPFPPYACTKEQKKYTLSNIVALAVANTQTIFGILCAIVAAYLATGFYKQSATFAAETNGSDAEAGTETAIGSKI